MELIIITIVDNFYFYLLQEDAHVANSNFMEDQNKALFGVFDGHGGREVAVFCHNNYETILNNTKETIDKEGE